MTPTREFARLMTRILSYVVVGLWCGFLGFYLNTGFERDPYPIPKHTQKIIEKVDQFFSNKITAQELEQQLAHYGAQSVYVLPEQCVVHLDSQGIIDGPHEKIVVYRNVYFNILQGYMSKSKDYPVLIREVRPSKAIYIVFH